MKYTQNYKSITKRDIFNAYMTSYFNAWFDNKNNFGFKKYITAFTPRLAMSEKKDIKMAIKLWIRSCNTALKNKEQYGHSVIIIRFEDLICNTQAVMHLLADYLGIRFDPILLIPTFNKIPILANTSFNLEPEGIIKSTLIRSHFKT